LDDGIDARREHQSAPKSHISIVVLPFANLNADPEQDYFAEAIVADLTTDLSRIAGSLVIDRNTALTYKGRPTHATEIGRELGVSFMLEGSVRCERECVRVNVELVETRTEVQIWAHRFDGDRSNLLALQDLITSNVAATLNAELVTAAARHVDPDVDPNALDLVLRARAVSSRPRTKQNLAEAHRLYEAGLRLQPDNAEARIGLAEVLVAMALSLISVNRESDLNRADELVSGALASQPNSAWAHYVKGEILRCSRRIGAAIVHYEAAISLNPNYAAAIANLGYSSMLVGKPADGVVLLERAIRMSPRDPMRAIWYSRVGQGDLYLERFESAKTSLEKSRALNSDLAWNHFYLAGTYALLGNLEEAKVALSAAQELSPGLTSIKDYKALSQVAHPELELMRERTLVAGLRLAGLPEVATDPDSPSPNRPVATSNSRA
jgi:TolB-like protein/Flp pilus assembly protein TadD